MNKHIQLVKKWLEYRDSVSLEELDANKKAAYAAYYAAYYAAAYHAATAKDYVKKYEELTKWTYI